MVMKHVVQIDSYDPSNVRRCGKTAFLEVFTVRPNFWERDPNYKAREHDFVNILLIFQAIPHLSDSKEKMP